MRLAVVCLIALLLSTAAALADISPWISFQGVLSDASGTPVPDGSYSVEFSVFNVESGGAILWTETQSVTTSGGIFNVYLGSVEPLDALAWDVPYWLGMRIEGEPWLVPRTPFTTVPYAAHAGFADTVLEGDQDWTIDGDDVYHETGYVGIGMGAGTAGRLLDVLAGATGAARFRNDAQGFNFAVYARNEYGTAGSFFGGSGADSYPSPHAALYARGQADHSAVHAVSDEQYAIFANSNTNQALHASTTSGDVCAQFDGGKVIVNDQIQVQAFYMPPGTSGYVLTSDPYGVGTWQPAPSGADSDWTIAGSNMYSGVSGLTGIGLSAPTAKLEILGDTTDEALEVSHSGASVARVVNLRRENIAAQGNDLLQLAVPAGSHYLSQFIECERGATVEFSVDGDGFVTSNEGASFGGSVTINGTSTVNGKLNVANSYEYGAEFGSNYLGAGARVVSAVSAATGSSNVIGVYGESVPQDQYGVGGVFKGGYRGVEGVVEPTGSGGYIGVWGTVVGGSGDNYGVYGEAFGSGTNWSGYFAGDVVVVGTLIGGKRVSRIDHPLDPEGMYLEHASVESDELVNVYSGNVTLDERGEATVELPEWFEALNRDFRYQLTCIGGFAPVYVAETIADNRFSIAGGEPGMVVSWQVTGVRHDALALADPLTVESEKAADDAGRYAHPEAFGRPRSETIGYQAPLDHGAGRSDATVPETRVIERGTDH